MLYAHGGAYIGCTVPLCNFVVLPIVSTTSVPVLAVEYRLAPEHPHPIPIEDCFTALTWLRDNASDLSPAVDSTRIGIYGESAGGGLAASLTLLARDRHFHPPIAKQILVYPMIDDRTTTPSNQEILPFLGFSYADNLTGWTALLGADTIGTHKVSEYAAAPRAKDQSGLPPAYIDVGDLDIFYAEDVDYATRLLQAQTNVELHVYPGVPHAWDLATPNAELTRMATANRFRAIRKI